MESLKTFRGGLLTGDFSAHRYCISESEAMALHAQLDVLAQGFVDLFALSNSRSGCGVGWVNLQNPINGQQT